MAIIVLVDLGKDSCSWDDTKRHKKRTPISVRLFTPITCYKTVLLRYQCSSILDVTEDLSSFMIWDILLRLALSDL